MLTFCHYLCKIKKRCPLYHAYLHHKYDEGQRMWDVMTVLGWLHPECFVTTGPYEISLTDDMILINNHPTDSSKHYVQYPAQGKQDTILNLIRQYCSQY